MRKYYPQVPVQSTHTRGINKRTCRETFVLKVFKLYWNIISHISYQKKKFHFRWATYERALTNIVHIARESFAIFFLLLFIDGTLRTSYRIDKLLYVYIRKWLMRIKTKLIKTECPHVHYMEQNWANL